MSQVDIKIVNLPQIRAAFARSPQKMADELNKAIKLSLFDIQGETILNVSGQRGINVITGGLKSAATRPPHFEQLKGIYPIDIFYAIYVHDGTSRMKARPFLKQAVDTEQSKVDDYFKKAVQNTLDDLARGTL